MAPELKNEESLKIDDVEAKLLSLKSAVNYGQLSVSSSPETRAYVTDVIDRVSLPAKPSKTDYIDPFKSENFNIFITIERKNFRALLDTRPGVTVVSAKF